MNETPTNDKPIVQNTKRGGYIAAVVGADIGFVIGAIIGIILGAVQISSIALFDFSSILTLLSALLAIALGGYIGGLIGCFIALTLTGQPRKGRTVGFLALLYPLPLLLAGTDLFIGALIIPLLARWLALRNS